MDLFTVVTQNPVTSVLIFLVGLGAIPIAKGLKKLYRKIRPAPKA